MKTILLRLLLTCFYISRETSTDLETVVADPFSGGNCNLMIQKTTRWLHLFWMPVFIVSEETEQLGAFATGQEYMPDTHLFI